MPVTSNSSPSSSSTPTTRSRTLLFISYRDSTARPTTTPFNDDSNDSEHHRLIPSSDQNNSQHVALDFSLPPIWVDVTDQVHQILAGTQHKISALEKLHAKHVLPGFSDRSAEEREIEEATNDITRDFRKCQSLIQDISSHTFPPAASSSSSQREALTAKNVQRGLAAKVQEMSATFRKKQRVYMEKLQGHAIKNQDLLIASGAISLKGSEGMNAVDEDVEAVSHKRPPLSSTLSQEGVVLESDINIRTRDHEITEIAKSITTLADLFKDLSNLVIDQGTLLDSVEYNIEQTSVHIAEAVTELKIATKYQRNTGRRQCIFLLILIIFGLIIVLIFKPRRHEDSSSPASSFTPLDNNIDEPWGTSSTMTFRRMLTLIRRWNVDVVS